MWSMTMYVNKQLKQQKIIKKLTYCIALLLINTVSQAAQPSNVPLSVKSTVPLNLIITIDDTLNMGYTHSPEGQESHDPNYNLASPDYNGLFYDPDYTYQPPPRYYMSKENGQLMKTSYPLYDFSQATVDGYQFKAQFGQPARDANLGDIGPWNLNKVTPRGWDESTFQTWALGGGTSYHYYRWNPMGRMSNGKPCGPDPRLIEDENEIGTRMNCWIGGKNLSGSSVSEKQNYSNWLAYYASRMNRVKTILAFLMDGLDENVRVTWQSVQGCYSARFNASEDNKVDVATRCAGVNQTLAPFTGQHKADFYTFLHSRRKLAGERNPQRAAMKRVNDYLTINDKWSPYRDIVGDASSKERACRPTVHLIATHGKFGDTEGDGYMDDPRSSLHGNFRNDVKLKTANRGGSGIKLVNTGTTLPDGKDYNPRAPYKDDIGKNRAKTLSDYAFEGWAKDARPDLMNTIAPTYRDESGTDEENYWNPKNDPATWQHVTTYVLSVGGLKKKAAAYNLDWNNGTYNGSYLSLLTGNKQWPVTPGKPWCIAYRGGENYGGCDNVKAPLAKLDDWGTAQVIVDGWHAAINGRGQIYNAEDLDKWDGDLPIWDKIRNDIMTAGSLPNKTTTISVASDSNIASDDSFYYETKFDSLRWVGMITQYQYDKNRNKVNLLEFHSKLTSPSTNEGSNRKIYINTGEETKGSPSIKGKLVEFTTNNYGELSKKQQADLETSLESNNAPSGETLGKLRLEWLRGNSAYEGNYFRERYHHLLLGDIVNNTPLAIKPPEGNPFYMNLRGSNYEAFKMAQANRPTYLYVGANDGMLHVFNQFGTEVWAFIPAGVAGNLHLLSDKDYASVKDLTNNASKHRFYVDGPLVTDDVYFDGDWHTVLVGTLGRGGQGVFALDVTDPDHPNLLWEYGVFNQSLIEFDASTLKAPGYILSAPVIAPLIDNNRNTSDYVIVGNGYGSTNSGKNTMPVYTEGSVIAINIATGQLSSSLGVVASADNKDLGFAGVVGMKKINPIAFSNFAVENNKFYTGNTSGEIYYANPIGGASVAIAKGNTLLTNIPKNREVAGKSIVQSITAAPEIARVKIARDLADILFVGTGKYFEAQDAVDILNAHNSIYAFSVAGKNIMDSSTSINDLIPRTVKDEVNTNANANLINKVRYLEGESINWSSQKGFYIDLPTAEAVIDQPYAMGSVVFVMVMVMNSDDPCKPETNYWLMAIDPRSGKMPDFPVFDTNGDGIVDNRDMLISGIFLKSKPILQGGSNALAVTNEGQIAIQPYDSHRVRINRVEFKGDSFFKN